MPHLPCLSNHRFNEATALPAGAGRPEEACYPEDVVPLVLPGEEDARELRDPVGIYGRGWIALEVRQPRLAVKDIVSAEEGADLQGQGDNGRGREGHTAEEVVLDGPVEVQVLHDGRRRSSPGFRWVRKRGWRWATWRAGESLERLTGLGLMERGTEAGGVRRVQADPGRGEGREDDTVYLPDPQGDIAARKEKKGKKKEKRAKSPGWDRKPTNFGWLGPILWKKWRVTCR